MCKSNNKRFINKKACMWYKHPHKQRLLRGNLTFVFLDEYPFFIHDCTTKIHPEIIHPEMMADTEEKLENMIPLPH